jgi:hypothetical protein
LTEIYLQLYVTSVLVRNVETQRTWVDWRATFAALAGADPFDHRAAAFGGGGVLPPIDS